MKFPTHKKFWQVVAERVNELQAEELKNAPVVYGLPASNIWSAPEVSGPGMTHQAQLVNIEKLNSCEAEKCT